MAILSKPSTNLIILGIFMSARIWRWDKGLYLEIKYLHEDGWLIGQKSIDANGEKNDYYVKENR